VESLLQIGVTGGIGSGKSLVSRIFQCLGIPVYDADTHAKELMTTDGILVSNIRKEFGELSFNTDGSLNRKYLSLTVFNDAVKLKKLNSLIHPGVAKDYDQWVEQRRRFPYVMKEAAILFEANSSKTLDKVIVVSAPEALRIERVLNRDPHRTEDQVRTIIRNQMPDVEKVKRGDFVIVNDEKVLVIPQVLELHSRFLSMGRQMNIS
jgi:dephospho-CoA kinase